MAKNFNWIRHKFTHTRKLFSDLFGPQSGTSSLTFGQQENLSAKTGLSAKAEPAADGKTLTKPRQKIFLFLAALFLLTLLFGLFQLPGGDDWNTFYRAARRVIEGEPLYGTVINGTYYSNPSWVILLFIPLALFPFRWGLAFISALTLIIAWLFSQRYNFSLIKFFTVVFSPAMIYILLHGQIEMLMLAGIFLPFEWWPLVALSKPQVTIGLLFAVKPKFWLRAAVIITLVLLFTFLLFGNWPAELLVQPVTFAAEGHNLWLGLWPFQVQVGVALIMFGLNRKDERFLFSASPFLFPYAATSSLIGPWITLCSFLKDWQCLVVLAFWWGAAVYRYFV